MSVLEKFSLSGTTILITGATSGIGEALALACAEAGACVAAIGRNAPKLSALQAKLSAISSLPHYTGMCDVSNFAEIPSCIHQIVAQCGKIYGLVHCAGVAQSVPLKVMTPEIYERIYKINVIAGYEFIREISNRKNLDNSKGASFVLVSSVSALKGEAGILAYSSSKGAILSGTKSIAAELYGKQIRVNCIVPGLIVDTPMGKATFDGMTENAILHMEQKHCLGMGKAEYLTGPIIFLLSSASSWMTGTALCVDGGYTL